MGDRAYILLDIMDGKVEQATEALRTSPGVVIAETLEGSPDIIVVTEAPERQQLAKLTIQALASVETITEHVCLLPARDELNSKSSIKLSQQRRTSAKKVDPKRFCQRSKPN